MRCNLQGAVSGLDMHALIKTCLLKRALYILRRQIIIMKYTVNIKDRDSDVTRVLVRGGLTPSEKVLYWDSTQPRVHYRKKS